MHTEGPAMGEGSAMGERSAMDEGPAMDGRPAAPAVAPAAERGGLDAHHRATVNKLFNHPVGHNIQWHDVLSLLQSVGEVDEHPDGRVTVTVGAQTVTFAPPRHHDMDDQQVVDLRRMLKGAGFTPS